MGRIYKGILISNSTLHYYTQDYLGNNRAVINNSTGFFSRYALRKTRSAIPYGAVIADLGTPTTGQPYKFGGKELITAYGLNEYDFGARQYYPAVPAFTRIDPMAEKYPWLSPYLYCANNPVNLVDPTGMDTWTLDETGHLINYEVHDEYDRIVVNNANNEEIANWQGDYGSIRSQTSFITKGIDCSVFETKNDNIGTSVFEFLADNISVEWSQIKTGVNDNSPNYISTSHMPTKEYSAEFFIRDNLSGVNIRADIHSHPRGSDFPSGMDSGPNWTGDIRYARWLEIFAPSVPDFYIYIPSKHEYVKYNSQSTKYDFPRFLNNLPAITIEAVKKR